MPHLLAIVHRRICKSGWLRYAENIHAKNINGASWKRRTHRHPPDRQTNEPLQALPAELTPRQLASNLYLDNTHLII
jgi:hypothetical protein